MKDARKALQTLLKSLGESSQFASSGSLAPVLPGLEVKGVGAIGTPIPVADAKRLIARSAQAPYGRGLETVVDTKVRRVWQIEPSQFKLRNPEWEPHIAAIVNKVKEEFSIGQDVNAELYKLLVYEKGSFFTPHRDSEKTERMFATLVICLPSPHKGGTLIVEHDGRTKTIDFGGKDAEFTTQYAAFYADCQHQIAPVTAGYRICLVYNLSIAGKNQPAAPQNSAEVDKAAQLLNDFFANSVSTLSKIAFPFAHQYTEAGLDPKHLKGSDRSLLDVLSRAALTLDYQCHIALLTHQQSGAADYSTWDDNPYERRRSTRWSDDEDDGENNDGDDSGVEMGEVYDEELSLDHWFDPQGQKRPFGEIHIEKDEVVGLDDETGWQMRQEVHEATGNEGVSVERWYRQGVVVIWPREHYFGIVSSEGPATAIPVLEEMADHAKDEATLEAYHPFVGEIIRHWKPQRTAADAKISWSGRVLKLLERVGTVQLVEHFVRDVFPGNFDGSEGEFLRQLGDRWGWKLLESSLRQFFTVQEPTVSRRSGLAQILSIAESVCSDPPELSKERREVCASLAPDLVAMVERWDTQKIPSWYPEENERAGVVASLFHILATLAASDQIDRFCTHVLANPKRYDLRAVVIPDVRAIAHWLPKVRAAQPAFSRLLDHCLSELRTATACLVEPPRDWARDAKLDCDCEQCRALCLFLRDPVERVARFRLRKDLRQHLHQQIDRHQCDCTHVTERTGSPQTLVCTKMRGSYDRSLKQYETDKATLAALESLAGTDSTRASTSRTTKRSSIHKS